MKTCFFKDHPLFELPFGVVDANGELQKSFGLKRLTGEMREQIAQSSRGKPPLELLNNAVHALLTHIGPWEAPGREVVSAMTTYDRDYILTVARLHRQPMETQTKPCEKCEMPIGLDTNMMETLELNLPDEKDFVKQGGDFTWLFIDKEVGVHECQMRVRTVGDEEEAFRGERAKQSYGAEHFLVSRSILSFNGQGKLTPLEVSKLDVDAIDSLSAAFDEKNFGVDLRYLVDCDNCNEENEFKVEIVSSFLGVGRRRGKQK